MLGGASLAVAGCAPVNATGFPSASELPEERRHPDGVAIDPVSLLPASTVRAEAGEGVVTLRAPLGISRALDVVAELFRRIVAEDSDGLSELFTRDALALPLQGSQGQSPSAGLWWEQRFRKLEYGKLAGEPIYRESELEIFRAEDVLAAPRHPAIQTDTLDDSDVVIRVPIVTARVAAERLLADELVIWLRRDGDGFKIYRLLEDFQLQ